MGLRYNKIYYKNLGDETIHVGYQEVDPSGTVRKYFDTNGGEILCPAESWYFEEVLSENNENWMVQRDSEYASLLLAEANMIISNDPEPPAQPPE